MMQKIILLLFFWSFYSCHVTKGAKSSTADQAEVLAHKFIITDGHVDLPYRLKVLNFRFQKEYIGLPFSSEEGNFDFVRAKKGGLDAPFMSVYIPSNLNIQESKQLADTLIRMVNWISKENSDYFEVATSPAEVKNIVGKGKIALPMGMENGSPIETLEDVKYWREKGISYVTLTHAKDNQICDSSYDTTGTWNGLSKFGEEVVRKLPEEGIMIDVSHISDSAFYDVLAITPVPLLASHSSARKFTPKFQRNMSDEIIKSMGKNGGVIMINFSSIFLDGSYEIQLQKDQAEIDAMLKEKGVTAESEEGKNLIRDYRQKKPQFFSDVEKVADHIDHVVALAGINHVGFGSDFDGVGDSLPSGLKDVSGYPNLIRSLLNRGYSESDIEKICSGNLFRVWQATLDYQKARE